jgi:HD-GYP domain-containing protein (c-di-GMP phosphodiesterase class II)
MTKDAPQLPAQDVRRPVQPKAGRKRMLRGIHGVVVKRLAVAWILLSLAVGGSMAWLELSKIDERALGLAMSASESLWTHVDQVGVEHADQLQTALAQLLRNNFVQAAVADAQGRIVAEIAAPGQGELLAQAGWPARLAVSGSSGGSHRLTWLTDELIMQMSVPIRDRNGAVLGNFSGAYRVDPATRRHARADLARNVSLALLAVLATALALYPVIIGLNRGVLQLSAGLMRSNIELMEVLGSAIAKRDSDTDLHNYRVCLYSIRFAEALGLPESEIRTIIAGAFLHDVGKIGISDAILLKPGKLTAEEFSTMKTHVELGTDIVAKSTWLDSAREVIEFHHERFDGNGYRQGLKGESIPLAARIFAIVDVFDALNSRRPYKEPFPPQVAMRILAEGRSSHFDPRLFDVFEKIAAGLLAEISELTETGLRVQLHDRVTKYFFDGSDYWTTSGCPAWLAEQCR